MTAIVLMKGRFDRMTLEIKANWDRVVKTTNDLVINMEFKDGAKPLFRVGRMTCNVATST